MASIHLKDKILYSKNVNITINSLPIHSYGFDGEDLIIRVVETADWERAIHYYYEWTISQEQWESATVDGNKVTVQYETSSIDIEVWNIAPVDLGEFN